MHAHTDTGCKKEAIICRHVSRVAWIFSVFYFSWQNLMFCRSVCFYYSTILTNPSLCPGREDVELCFYTSEEIIMNYRKGEGRESVRSLSSSFPNIRLCTQSGLNVGIEHEALALAVVHLSPCSPVLALPLNL